MDLKRKGSLFYFGERILLGTAGIVTEPHSHYAVSILVSLGNSFHLYTKSNQIIESQGIIIPPNYYHKLDASQSEMVIIQLDPKSEEYKRIEMDLSPKTIDSTTREQILKIADPLFGDSLDCKSARALYNQILSLLGSGSTTKKYDERIEVAIQRIKEKMPNPVSLTDLSEISGISTDRFMHLFKDNMGIPLRQYLLWQRLHIAAKLLQGGENLTTASHAAGFSDQAHLSRTFKKMFGVKPSLFLGTQSLNQVCFCED
ncbi:AraC family transcriptional regulator [Leptospira sp. 2 VSF19]|uniref:AraC family transcriptional regulator n=1 Tax=Leptospira soteropolitanensis TaxID=2950025 RepID=A0AAW5VBA7_9LEPT|nr:AraC family transcriptional regulator [Leptospira soteropolitanensis]MCW7492831.1 AraC family transcriptional regulator [Leptospira soteropolitanensis]MCW7500066.1 AraC family transcriptional regulator [Leptospira soteropolitanensis]MCW7522317.1 AraC family transcriptional regulator [Leptospira soteropolitanensis]MCW7526173.1 AraC family transcriptional regulator [Leptospira soteropolitanensis]MCW7529715.1 AraC family transcriptional regulator [Leptospira soteropolitanensis]